MEDEKEFDSIFNLSLKDQEEIGETIINKIIHLFKTELNEYIATLKEDENNERIFKSVFMADFISENVFLNIIFNTSLSFGVSAKSIFKDGQSIIQRINEFEEKRVIAMTKCKGENKDE